MDQPKWKDTFHFTQSERRGVFILALILLLLLMVSPFIDRLYLPTETDFTVFKKAIADFELDRNTVAKVAIQPFLFNPNAASKEDLVQIGLTTELAQRIINYRKKGGRFYKKEDLQKIYGLSIIDYNRLAPYAIIPQEKPIAKKVAKRLLRPHYFDPNKISKEALLAMGVSPKAVKQWMNYRRKGGLFKEKEEIRKIYALTDRTYLRLAPYIQLPPIQNSFPLKRASTVSFKSETSPYNAASNVKIDVNTANAQDWQLLKGIGSAYAKRIINFRDKLGGFISIDQIRTTYGLPDSTFQKIKPQLILSPIPSPLSINTATLEILTAHPYIQKRQAKAIVNYRKNHGGFKKMEDLKKVKVLSAQELERLKPYLDFK